MSGKWQKIQLRLAFGEEGRSEAPKAPGEGTERLTAKRRNESPAKNSEPLMEEVCERESCLQALKRVKSNKGSAGNSGAFTLRLGRAQELLELRPRLLEGFGSGE